MTDYPLRLRFDMKDETGVTIPKGTLVRVGVSYGNCDLITQDGRVIVGVNVGKVTARVSR